MKLHSIDVTQAYIRAPFPPGHPDLYMELPSLDPQKAMSEYMAATHLAGAYSKNSWIVSSVRLSMRGP